MTGSLARRYERANLRE